MKYFVSLDGTEYSVELHQNSDGSLAVAIDDKAPVFDSVHVEDIEGRSLVLLDNRAFEVTLERKPGGLQKATLNGLRSEILVQSERDRRLSFGKATSQAGSGWTTSPMPGRIVKVLVEEGDHVEKGAALVIIEAMKMQNELLAEHAGVVNKVRVRAGDTVERDAELVRIEP